MSPEQSADILDYWFGQLTDGIAAPQLRKRWYSFDPATDLEIESRFKSLLNASSAWQLTDLSSPRDQLAFIILNDQFPRNIYRGDAQAFAFDARALELTQNGVASQADAQLALDERCFYYMPLEHSESLKDQQLCVSLFEDLFEDTVSAYQSNKKHQEVVEGFLRFAKSHLDVIEKFGRFPHRNRVLGRASTVEEVEFLKQASSYGQG